MALETYKNSRMKYFSSSLQYMVMLLAISFSITASAQSASEKTVMTLEEYGSSSQAVKERVMSNPDSYIIIDEQKNEKVDIWNPESRRTVIDRAKSSGQVTQRETNSGDNGRGASTPAIEDKSRIEAEDLRNLNSEQESIQVNETLSIEEQYELDSTPPASAPVEDSKRADSRQTRSQDDQGSRNVRSGSGQVGGDVQTGSPSEIHYTESANEDSKGNSTFRKEGVDQTGDIVGSQNEEIDSSNAMIMQAEDFNVMSESDKKSFLDNGGVVINK